jgi:predicted small secreted protein
MKGSAQPVIGFLVGPLLPAFGLQGCNTTKGAGEDLQRGGEKTQDSTERHAAQ